MTQCKPTSKSGWQGTITSKWLQSKRRPTSAITQTGDNKVGTDDEVEEDQPAVHIPTNKKIQEALRILQVGSAKQIFWIWTAVEWVLYKWFAMKGHEADKAAWFRKVLYVKSFIVY